MTAETSPISDESSIGEQDRKPAALTGPLIAPPAHIDQYSAPIPKSVLDLQQFRQTSVAAIEDLEGSVGEATLINLNPAINQWFILELHFDADESTSVYHLQNPLPETQSILLDPSFPRGLTLELDSRSTHCDLWFARQDSPLARARRASSPYASLCDERLYLRNPTSGRKTTLEWVTDFLRDHVVGGETITVFVREKFFEDAFLETSELVEAGDPALGERPKPSGAPARPAIDPEFDGHLLTPAELGLNLVTDDPERLLVGRWYEVRGIPSVFLSALQPGLVSRELIDSISSRLNPLDSVELEALVYMVAFDLEEFELGFMVGTDHPRVGWSDRVPRSSVDPALPGPDGFESLDPLVMSGMVSPGVVARTVATFTGGFKRTHGAFKYSDLAHRNGGTHYGFLEHGTVLSKLQPELATAIVYRDGAVDLKTWRELDDGELWQLRHARQNGLPVVDHDPETGISTPGAMVSNWSQGNWSGSQDKRFRTLRAGLCLQQSDEGNYLIYGYFSSATPSAMARVFMAYRCKYAMLLDMNALEHTYLALYRVRAGTFLTQHLIDEMSVLDKTGEGQELPRFIGFADNRDFFYLLRRPQP